MIHLGTCFSLTAKAAYQASRPFLGLRGSPIVGCTAGIGTAADADVDAVSRGGMSAAQSCMWNCVGLRSMIDMWQISKDTLTRLRANLAGGERSSMAAEKPGSAGVWVGRVGRCMQV